MPLFPDEAGEGPSGTGRGRPIDERAPSERSDGPSAEPVEDVLTVAELDRRLKRVLEGASDGLSVSGEVAGLREVASGHMYFTLKDESEDASIGCVMYRTAPVRSRRLVVDGARVVLSGRATLYAPRGQLQLVAELARPAGRGALLVALERLKQKLTVEGLFAKERKRPLPADPHVIGVVTSADGAALHDIVKVAFRRARVKIVLARAPVQGPQAAPGLIRALRMLSRHPEVEAIILGRGGGSVDDLSAFNDEQLVRAVAECRVPVVSAVGHEIDTTLVDLVADARAATPSQAAELIVPDWAARVAMFRQLTGRLQRAMSRSLDERVAYVDDVAGRLERRIQKTMARRLELASALERRLARRHPSAVLASAKSSVGPLEARLASAMTRVLARASLGPTEVRLASAMARTLARGRAKLGDRASRLDALSPLAVLSRGYAIASRDDGTAVRAAEEAVVGETIAIRLARGSLHAVISARHVEPGPSAGSSQSPEEENAL